MHTMQFLIEAGDVSNFQTVGQVFGDSRLQVTDGFIGECYRKNQRAFDNVHVESTLLNNMIKKACNNSWFNWFRNTRMEDLGWVDFEREIATIVGIFDSYTSQNKEVTILRNDHVEPDTYRALISFNEVVSRIEDKSMYYCFNNACTYDVLPYARIRYIDREKVANLLYMSLLEFKDIFEQYLIEFIEKTIETSANMIVKREDMLFRNPYLVATYNYTKTHEFLYNTARSVIHVHGELMDNIVLGINSDEHDKLGTIDTSFIAFKKYFQRVKSNIDIRFNDTIADLHSSNSYGEGKLFIVGHSLDETDKDTLMEFINESTHVFIYYHTDSVLSTYIANMIKMYGKEKLEQMRRTGKLYFDKLPSLC